jgi:hypothetical protein
MSPQAAKEDMKLVDYEGAFVSQQENVILFDWDDTLMASTTLQAAGCRVDLPMDDQPLSEEQVAALKTLEVTVANVLRLALASGRVCIITNAEQGWVELSAAKFMPSVVPLLSKLKVVSARSTYESMFPNSPAKWKYYAFQEKLQNYAAFACKQRHVLSFGDSHVEREAVRAVTKGLSNTRTKSIKFSERPSLEQLRRQLDLVSNCFAYLVSHDGDLDLQLTVSATPEAQAPTACASGSADASAAGDAKMPEAAEAPVVAPQSSRARAVRSCSQEAAVAAARSKPVAAAAMDVRD